MSGSFVVKHALELMNKKPVKCPQCGTLLTYTETESALFFQCDGCGDVGDHFSRRVPTKN